MFANFFRRSKTPRLRRFPGVTAFVEVESLEELQLLSATTLLGVVASPLVNTASVASASATATPRQATPTVIISTPLGYTPAQIAQAYGFNQITFDNRTLAGNGAGETIAIVDAYVDPNISSDLQKFDAQFGLAAPASFTQVVEQGATTNSGWALETALDVEWAHAMAPGANIVLVEANNSSLSSLLSAVNYARNLPNVSVVSMSWGAGEFSSETAYDSYFTTPAGHSGITFVASSGDDGAGTTWPSVSPNVLAVGGTTLTTSAGGTYVGETAWSDSSGGISSFEPEPSYQQSAQSTGARTTPDVAYDANPNTGFAVFDSVAYAGQSGWFEVGGTSAGAPQWSALIAVADQGRATAGLAPLSNAQATLYTLPQSDFHDITSGSNGYPATTGYDLVTGRGSPVVTSIMRALTGADGTAAQTTAAAASPSTQAVHSNTTTTNGGSVSTTNAAIALVHPSSDDAFQIVAERSASASPFAVAARDDAFQSSDGTSSRVTAAVDLSARGSSIADLPSTRLAKNQVAATSAAFSTGLVGISRLGFAGTIDLSLPVDAQQIEQGADQEALSLAQSGLADSLDDAISSQAIDAYFSTGHWLADGTTPPATPTSTVGLGKTALAAIGSSLGLAGFWAGVRARRRRRQSP